MLRLLEGANPKKIVELFENINLGINSMISNYNNLYNEYEINMFLNISKLIIDQINKLKDNNYSYDELYNILEYEDLLKPFVFKCWNFEVNNGGQYISWFKNDNLGEMPQVVSSTFCIDVYNTFCNSRYGISYKVFMDGFLGGCSKDAATLIENFSKASIYTIGKTIDGSVINSYNLATVIITPAQLSDTSNNDYKSKHNEIILDSRYIEPIEVIYFNDNDLEMVNLISSKYNIPAGSKKK